MLNKRQYTIFTFATTTAAMKWEQLCQEQGLPGRIIPLPGSVAAGCGLCWRVPAEEAAAFATLDAAAYGVQDVVDVEMY